MTKIKFALLFLNAHWLFAVAFLLAIYSVVVLIHDDTITEGLRNWLWHHFPKEGYQSEKRPLRGEVIETNGSWYVNKGTFLGELISCPWCLGMWVSFAAFGLLVLNPWVTIALCFPVGFRVIPGLLHVYTG